MPVDDLGLPEPEYAIVMPISTEPVRAEIVKDSRDTTLRRLVIVAFFLIVLAFMAIVYRQSQDNHDAINSLRGLVKDQTHQIRLLRRANGDLRTVIIKQNRTLREAGLPGIPVPVEPPGSFNSGGGGTNRQGPPPQSQPSQSPHPSPRPSPHPHPHPSPHPSPHPTPTPTGICVPNPITHKCLVHIPPFPSFILFIR
jgi:hypothetical protein